MTGKCFIHKDRDAVKELNVPCAPGGKLWLCAECKCQSGKHKCAVLINSEIVYCSGGLLKPLEWLWCCYAKKKGKMKELK